MIATRRNPGTKFSDFDFCQSIRAVTYRQQRLALTQGIQHAPDRMSFYSINPFIMNALVCAFEYPGIPLSPQTLETDDNTRGFVQVDTLVQDVGGKPWIVNQVVRPVGLCQLIPDPG